MHNPEDMVPGSMCTQLGNTVVCSTDVAAKLHQADKLRSMYKGWSWEAASAATGQNIARPSNW